MQSRGTGIQHDNVAILNQRRRALADPLFRAEVNNFARVRGLFKARPRPKNGAAVGTGQQPLIFQLAEIGTNGGARYIKDVTHLRNSHFAFFPENTEQLLLSFFCKHSASLLFTARYARCGAGLPLRISRVPR